MIATRPLRTASAFVSVAAVLGSFVCSCLIFFQQTPAAPSISWINLAPLFSVPLGLTLDPLSRSMLFMVTGVGALIHIYSLGYMGDGRRQVALFRRALALHVLDARHRAREQFRDDVHLLGTGRRQFLFAHRPLVRARRRRRGREKSIHHQSHRRLRFHARHPDGLDRDRFVRLHRDRERDGALHGSSRIFDRRRAARLLRRGRQSRRNFRSTSGCRTRWKVRRRSRR